MDNFQLCRICISDNSNGVVMVSIFGEGNLSNMIKSFANVQIYEDDGLPKTVCMNCARNTMNACSFKRKCEESDSFFRNQLILQNFDSKKVKDIKNKDVIPISSDDESSSDDNTISKINKNILNKGNIFENNGHDINIQFTSQITVEDYNLPLIPEIELITPNDNEKITDDQIQGYQCSICYEIFSMRATLNHHLKLCHPESNPSYECFNCRKSYLSKRFLDKHIRRGRCVKKRKNQTRPMQCSDCQTLFPTGHHLGWHKRTGCPSKMSAQEQMRKLNLLNMQNNLSYRENVLRKLKYNKPKQKGRHRIKLNTQTINRAKMLIAQDATTSKMAQELCISRTFAWRLRKNLLSGVNLHERIEPNENPTQNSYDNSELVQLENNSELIEDESKLILKIEIESGDDEQHHQGHPNNELMINENLYEKPTNNTPVEVEIGSDIDNSADELDFQIDEDLHGPQPSCSSNLTDNISTNINTKTHDSKFNNFSKTSKKPRKQSVFIDANIYEQAKLLVAKSASTLDISRLLNVSHMSAWKLRDSILKGIPFTSRKSNQLSYKHETFNKPNQCIKDEESKEIPTKENRGRPKKVADRDERDKKITDAILSLIKEDNNIQYWKITERLAEQGFTISTSSVCQKLKSMGIHRRWKNK